MIERRTSALHTPAMACEVRDSRHYPLAPRKSRLDTRAMHAESHRCLLLMAACLTAPLGAVEPAARNAQSLDERHGFVESTQAARDWPGWRRPQRIVVRSAHAQLRDELAAVAPGVELVMVDSPEDAARAAVDADAVLGYCSAAILQSGTRVTWIQTYNAGVEHCVTVPAVATRPVLLTNMQRVAAPAMAEHGIAMLLALARGLHVQIPLQSEGRWDDSHAETGRMRVLAGKTLLVAGLGGIGVEVARRAHALGMKVIATRNSGREGPDFVSQVGGPGDLEAFAREADAVVAALPLTAATNGLFDARFFSAMRSDAYFVNLGRGESVITDDLVAALEAGRIGGAGLDVTDPEPLPPDHPLWKAPNVIITPHVSNATDDGELRWVVLRENLRRYVAGERLLSQVDPVRGY